MSLIYFIYVLVYTGNKAQSDDSSSNSKDVGASSIYHVRAFLAHNYLFY